MLPMTSISTTATGPARRVVLVPLRAERRSDAAVRRFRLARMRLEGPDARTPAPAPRRRAPA